MLKKLIISSLALLLIPTAAARVSAADFTQAVPLAAAGRFDDAANALLAVESIGRVAMTQRHDLAAAFQNVHDTFAQRGEYELLLKVDTHARKLFPSEKRSAVNLAEAHISAGEFEAAVKLLTESLDQRSIVYPERAGIDMHSNLLLARADLALGAVEEAQAAVQRAEAAGPNQAEVFYAKAQVMMRAGEREAAADSIAKAFAIDTQAAQPVDYLVKATCHQQNMEFDLAQKTIEDALKRYPAAPGLHYGLGQVYLARRAADPEDKTPWVARAFYTFQHEMMLSGAESTYSREAGRLMEIITALLSDEDEPDSYLRIAYGAAALANMKPGGYETALDYIEKGLRANGDDCLPLQMLNGHTHAALGKYEEAAQAYENVILAHPYFPPAYIDLGEIYLRLDRKEEALEMFAKGMTIDKENWRVKEMLKRMD